MTRAAIYTRISMDRQGAGLGVQRQEAACRELAAHKGWTVVEVYSDNDLSGSDRRKKRPAYQRLLSDCEAGQIDAIICWHTDRLTRQQRQLEDVIELAERHKIGLSMVQGDLDLSTPNGRMVARMLGAAARQEVEMKSERQLAKAAELAAAGKPSGGGTRPFGFEEDRITHRAHEVEIIRHAAHLLLNGMTLRATCRVLNERGDLTSTGRLWSTNTLKKMVCGPRVGGYRQHHGDMVQAVWKPILEPEVWEILRRELTFESRRTSNTFNRKHTWTGLLVCWRCDGYLGVRTVGGKPSYSCRSSHFNRWDASRNGGCQGTSVRQQLADEVLQELLLRRVEREHLGDVQPDDSTTALEHEIEGLEGRLEALAEEFVDHGDARAYRLGTQKVNERLDPLRADLSIRSSKVSVMVRLDPSLIRQQWPTMEPKDRRALAGAYVEKVVVGPARRGDNRFDPNRLQVRWL